MFDVASVKLSKLAPPGQFIPARMAGGPGTNDPAQIHWENVSLRSVLQRAYGLKDFRQVVAGKDPSVFAAYYDIVANVPAGATKDQFNVMMQNLLTQRIKLAVHRDVRPIPIYQLVVAKGGLKMKESPDSPGKPLDALPAEKGFPAIAAGRNASWTRTRDGHLLFRARALPVSCEPIGAPGCEFMSPLLIGGITPEPRILENKTGLAGRYDFTLDCTIPDKPAAPAADDLSDCFNAIEQQLGLKLVDTKEPMDVLVVDRVENPVEN